MRGRSGFAFEAEAGDVRRVRDAPTPRCSAVLINKKDFSSLSLSRFFFSFDAGRNRGRQREKKKTKGDEKG